jgi:uracil-DNA glycosylase
LQAFNDAGLSFNNIQDIIDSGVYITTAIKCGKVGYAVPTDAIKRCSFILEKELALFPGTRVILLMGDVAIRAVNYISQRENKTKVISTGSTYKIRNQQFHWDDKRVYPSYLMTGGNYLIEKTKRQMIAEDIKNAFITAGIRSS